MRLGLPVSTSLRMAYVHGKLTAIAELVQFVKAAELIVPTATRPEGVSGTAYVPLFKFPCRSILHRKSIPKEGTPSRMPVADFVIGPPPVTINVSVAVATEEQARHAAAASTTASSDVLRKDMHHPFTWIGERRCARY